MATHEKNSGKRLIETIRDAATNEAAIDAALRPTSFDDYIGQTDVIGNLRVSVKAASAGRWVMDHMLFTGPAGVGKTSLAQVIAAEIGVRMRATSAPALSHKGELITMLTSLGKGDV